MLKSTELSLHFGRQVVKLPIRKEERKRRPTIDSPRLSVGMDGPPLSGSESEGAWSEEEGGGGEVSVTPPGDGDSRGTS
jgi:hypothetical protein